ncbi:hypothetical protein BK120_23095 [Paenibacillus sp. FSL A5-0031]|uniref:hypothetical protein n=1 Tax=Paenibacillus sp. FSL A5-0031 TaxID=1920420 RepID=UPI00096F6EE8|nr:hypothetical protein [Paenibacillus sp. FSL A5-0031]OME78628.1 hypothetical protein BK120_23095 [Paenibacillus sp. FSL A5-0031]
MKFNREMFLKFILMSIALFTIVSPVFAEGVGEKVGGSMERNVNALIPGILLAISIYFIFVRDWMKFISFIAITILVAVFTNWTWVKALASKAYNAFLA